MGLFGSISGALGLTKKKGKSSSSGAETFLPMDEKALETLQGYAGDLSGMVNPSDYGGEEVLMSAIYKSNAGLTSLMTSAEKAALQSQINDTQKSGQVKNALWNQQLTDLKSSAPVASKFYKEALNGEDPTKAMNQASTDVMAAFDKSGDIWKRDMSRFGLNPMAFGDNLRNDNIERAKAEIGGRTLARDTAKEKNWNKLLQAMSVRGNPEVAGTGATTASGDYLGNYSVGSQFDNILKAIATSADITKLGLNPKEIQTKGKTSSSERGRSINLSGTFGFDTSK